MLEKNEFDEVAAMRIIPGPAFLYALCTTHKIRNNLIMGCPRRMANSSARDLPFLGDTPTLLQSQTLGV